MTVTVIELQLLRNQAEIMRSLVALLHTDQTNRAPNAWYLDKLSQEITATDELIRRYWSQQ